MITFEFTDMFLCAVLAGNSDVLSSTSLFDMPTADAGREEPLSFFSSLYRETRHSIEPADRENYGLQELGRRDTYALRVRPRVRTSRQL